MKGEEGPGVIEHVAICGSRMASHLPRTVKTLLVHGQTTDTLWRLAYDNGACPSFHLVIVLDVSALILGITCLHFACSLALDWRSPVTL